MMNKGDMVTVINDGSTFFRKIGTIHRVLTYDEKEPIYMVVLPDYGDFSPIPFWSRDIRALTPGEITELYGS